MRAKQRVQWAKLRVTFVSAVAVVILGVLLYLLTGGTLFTEKTTLYLYVPDATGIAEGSPARVDGIYVGKVDSVALSGSRDPKRVVRIVLQVERNSLAMIPVGSYAELGTDTLVGDKFVDVTSRGRGPTPPNSELPYQEPTDIFKTLDFAQFEKNLRQMEAVINDIEAGRGRVGQFVSGTQMYSDLQRRLADIEKSIRSAASTTDSLGQELYTDRLYRQLMKPVEDFDLALARLQSGQGAGRLLRDTADYDRLVSGVGSLRASIASFRSSSFVQSDEMYVKIDRAVASIARSVDEINSGPIFGAPQSYESMNGLLRELTETMRDFRGNPRKYMRIKVF
jgi:phospholipid/cholesterol/gamma-HCH transport system substrate-binding protein